MIRAALIAAALAGGVFSLSAGARPAERAACRPAAGVTLSLTIGGHVRTVIVHVPSHASASLPLVLNLHGSGSNASQQEKFTGMDATADRDGFVVAYPQAAIPALGGFDWNIPDQPLLGGASPPAGAADDVAFLRTLVGDLEKRECVDPKRVYAVGFSGGARMASQAGCDLAGTFAAVAAVSGLRFPMPCPTARAMPVLAFHGTADPIDPYNGNGQGYWRYSVPTAAARWAAHDGCRSQPAITKPAARVTLTTYAGCGKGASVELYTIEGSGHTWPGGPPLPPRYAALLGPQTNAVDANTLIWRFFAAHPLP